MKKLLIIMGCLLVVGCGNQISDEIPDDAYITISNEDIEVFDEVYLSDIISDTNVDIEDYQLNTDVIGEKEIEFYYTYDDRKYVYKTTINVVDTVQPKIFGSSSRTVEVGYEGNLNS